MIPFNNRFRRNPGTGINAPKDTVTGNTRLHEAVENGSYEDVRTLLQRDANPNQPNYEGDTPLHLAARTRGERILKLLLEHDANPNIANAQNKTPFVESIAYGRRAKLLGLFVDYGAAIGGADNRGRTPLHVAAEKGDGKRIAFLLDRGADINAEDAEGDTPLHMAVANDRQDAVLQLLDRGARADTRNKKLYTPLHVAADKGREKIARRLLQDPDVRKNINEHKTFDDGWTPAVLAVRNKHEKLAEILLEAGSDPNVKDHQNRQLVYHAVECGDRKMVELVIEHGADVRKASSSKIAGRSLLHEAVNNGKADIVMLLSKYGIDPDPEDSMKRTPLVNAVGRYSTDCVKALLEIGANPNHVDEYGKRPIDEVCGGWRMDEESHKIAFELLRKGANPNISPHLHADSAPIHEAIQRENVKMVELLIANRANIHVRDRVDGRTPFLRACRSGSVKMIERLAMAGARLDDTDKNGRNGINLAARSGSEDTIKLLAKKGVDVNAPDVFGRTAILNAVDRYNLDAVKTLIEVGADASIADKSGRTVVHYAATNNMPDVVKTVMEGKSKVKPDLDAKDADGETPLMIAAKYGNERVIEVLMAHGADATVADEAGHTPLETAVKLNYGSAVRALIKGGADITQRDRKQWTLLHHAATMDMPTTASALIEAGALLDARNADGDTPLHVAIKGNKGNMVEYLLRKGADYNIENKAHQTPLDLARGEKQEHIAALLEAFIRASKHVETSTDEADQAQDGVETANDGDVASEANDGAASRKVPRPRVNLPDRFRRKRGGFKP